MKWFIYVTAALFVISSVVSADEVNEVSNTKESLIHLSQPDFHDQIANRSCGYWDERLVRVCDYRTVLVDEPYTACHYNCVSGACGYYPPTLTRTHAANHNCQASFTLGPPFGSGGNPIHPGVYQLNRSEQLTRQIERTEEYNCRMEHRMVWVQLPPDQCGYNPHAQASTTSTGLSWQYAGNFSGSICPTGSIPTSAPMKIAGSACSAADSMARTDRATNSHWHGAGYTCYQALQCR